MTQETIKAGLKFTSTNFTMTAEVYEVDTANNKLSVLLTATDGHSWLEKDWNLQHTIWGFERGEYITVPSKKKYRVTLQLIVGYYDDGDPRIMLAHFDVEAENEQQAIEKAKALDKTKYSIEDAYADEVDE